VGPEVKSREYLTSALVNQTVAPVALFQRKQAVRFIAKEPEWVPDFV